jgi:hypothetical protein
MRIRIRDRPVSSGKPVVWYGIWHRCRIVDSGGIRHAHRFRSGRRRSDAYDARRAVATAIGGGLTVTEPERLGLAYAPAFSPVRIR